MKVCICYSVRHFSLKNLSLDQLEYPKKKKIEYPISITAFIPGLRPNGKLDPVIQCMVDCYAIVNISTA